MRSMRCSFWIAETSPKNGQNQKASQARFELPRTHGVGRWLRHHRTRRQVAASACEVLSYGHLLQDSFGVAEVDRKAALAFCKGEAEAFFWKFFWNQMTKNCWG